MFEFVILLSSLCSVTASSCDQVPECLPDNCNLSISQTDVGKVNLDWSKTWWDLDLSCVQEMFISLNGKLTDQLIDMPFSSTFYLTKPYLSGARKCHGSHGGVF